ncbi:hypothetical protein K380107A5_22560 [Holdemania massiliensis]
MESEEGAGVDAASGVGTGMGLLQPASMNSDKIIADHRRTLKDEEEAEEQRIMPAPSNNQ